ncbi:DMT family transporter [Streptomyces sp. NBC_00683]|uniref:DMT family transporter n=1 Tax=unclassified Streptomyces TaxID=2593676 RepID=UPI002E36B8B0|nr:DMT family transporter [Streptomyces sp. NBC_00683]
MTSAQADQGTTPPPETPVPAAGTPRLAVVAGVVTVVLWASAFIGIRAAGDDIDPGALTLARLFIGAVLLGAVVLIRRVPMPPRADAPRLILCGFLWFGVYNVALNAAEQRIDAGTTSMIISLGPVLIAVLAGLLLKEGFPRSLVIGGTVALAGVLLIGLATSSEGLDAGTGSALALLAAVAYAAGVVTEKPLLANSSALVVTWLACVVGAVLCLPFLPQLIDNLSHASGESIAWTIYLGVFPTSVAFTTWGYALARSTAGKMGALTYLSPPIAVTLAWLILAETPPWLAVVGGALSLGGVVFSQRKK